MFNNHVPLRMVQLCFNLSMFIKNYVHSVYTGGNEHSDDNRYVFILFLQFQYVIGLCMF